MPARVTILLVLIQLVAATAAAWTLWPTWIAVTVTVLCSIVLVTEQPRWRHLSHTGHLLLAPAEPR